MSKAERKRSGRSLETPELSVSFIVPTFNRAAFLVECLHSILPQMKSGDEVTVVVDGSTDDTLSALEQFSDCISVVQTDNRGKSAALNTGLAQTTRPLVWFVDDDDLLAPDARNSLISLLAESPDADIAYGRQCRFHVDPESQKRMFSDTGHWRYASGDHFLIHNLEDLFVHQPGMVAKRALYEKVGPFDETLNRSVDYEMIVRLALAGTAVTQDDIVFYQRQHGGMRGRATEPISADERERSWLASDQHIFRRLQETLPLSAYLPSRQISSSLDRRDALIERGTVMARKGFWRIAVGDYRAALDQSDAPLTPFAVEAATRAFASKYGCEQLMQTNSLTADLAHLAKQGGAGSELARAIARGLRWRIRNYATQRRIGASLRTALAYAHLKLATAPFGAVVVASLGGQKSLPTDAHS